MTRLKCLKIKLVHMGSSLIYQLDQAGDCLNTQVPEAAALGGLNHPVPSGRNAFHVLLGEQLNFKLVIKLALSQDS